MTNINDRSSFNFTPEFWPVHSTISSGRGEALLMLGSALCTWVLSMFMSNTATTAMMLPIVGAIIESLREVTLAVDNDVMKVRVRNDRQL